MMGLRCRQVPVTRSSAAAIVIESVRSFDLDLSALGKRRR
jgi:hypothetical protein